jgi:hypothetical protein
MVFATVANEDLGSDLDLDETSHEWALAASLRRQIDRDQQHDPDADREHECAAVAAARKHGERGMGLHDVLPDSDTGDYRPHLGSVLCGSAGVMDSRQLRLVIAV